jgi:ATP-dependent Clp protease ATP-binding subunit ClpA
MFERFTDRARRVVVLAEAEARMLGHNYTGTEHILLGLIHEGQGVAARALESLGISLDTARQRLWLLRAAAVFSGRRWKADALDRLVRQSPRPRRASGERTLAQPTV